MELSVDKLGRVVIPKSLREHYHLHPGTRLRVREDAGGIWLQPVADEPPVREQGGVLVIVSNDQATLSAHDVDLILARERDRHPLP